MTIYYIFTGSKQNKVDQQQPKVTLRIHRGRRSNSVPREFTNGLRNQLKGSKSVDSTTSSSERKHYTSKQIDRINDDADDNPLVHKSPILHMMLITQNRKETMETFLLNKTTGDDSNTENSPKRDSGRSKRGTAKRLLKVQAKRFRMETKAAKTLAIIVGGFIFCWLPFFTMYLVRAFCIRCIQPLVFSILFWLGYCNSAINPLIYALFSKDFRLAFKRLICNFFCIKSNEIIRRNSNHSADGGR